MTRESSRSPELIALGRIVNIQNSNVDKIIESDEIAVKLCNYVDVYYNDKINDQIDFKTGSALPREIEKFSLRAGDVLITKDSESPDDIAIPAIVEEGAEGVVCGYHLAMLRSKSDSVHSKYLFWALNSKSVKEQFSNRAQGITRFGLTLSGISSVRIPLPDLPTQKAIADFLDRETARIDQLIEKKQRLVELLEDSRVSKIVEGVTGSRTEGVESSPFSDGRPGWKRTRLQYCIESARNGAWGSEPGEDEKDVVCLRVADFDWRNLTVSDSSLTTRSVSHSQFIKLAFKSGDILLEKSGGGEKTPVGRVVQFQEEYEAICSNFVSRVRPSSLVSADFLTYLLSGMYMSGYSHQFIKQNTGIQNLDDGALFATSIFLPSRTEQDRIVERLNDYLEEIAKLQSSVEKSLKRLSELRSALITAAVSGQIDMKELARSESNAPTQESGREMVKE